MLMSKHISCMALKLKISILMSFNNIVIAYFVCLLVLSPLQLKFQIVWKHFQHNTVMNTHTENTYGQILCKHQFSTNGKKLKYFALVILF